MGGGAKLLKLLAGEDVDGNQVDLGVTVLASLGGGHIHNLARSVLDADEAVLAKGRAETSQMESMPAVGPRKGVAKLTTAWGRWRRHRHLPEPQPRRCDRSVDGIVSHGDTG